MFWNPISWWLELLKHGAIDPCPDEDPLEDRPADPDDPIDVAEPEDIEPEYQLRSVGAWTGWGSFMKNSAIERDLKFARRIGLGRIDVIVNDHSAKR